MHIIKLARLACVLSAIMCPAEGLAMCPVGYMPPECQQLCRPGSFGVNCASVCPATCTGGSCRPETGFCYRCRAGFTGPKCSLKCRSGFFGEGCKRPCPVNCFQNACDPFTGFCERCLKGYGGVKCEQRAVLLNPSARAVMVEDGHASGAMASTDKSIVVYVLVVVLCCVLPVCAVVLCFKFAKNLSSRRVQQDEKAPTSNHTPVSLSTQPRRPCRLTLNYEHMQTIEEESSNQLTLDEDIHQRTASNPATASVTTLNEHGFYTPSQNYTFESPQVTALNSTDSRMYSKDLYNYQAMDILSKECNPSFDFSHTTKEMQGFEADDMYNQSRDVCVPLQSTPVIDLGIDAANNLILTDQRSHKSVQASFSDNEQCLHDKDGSVLSLNSDMSPLRPRSPTSGTHMELAPEMLRRASSSAMAESNMELVSETPRLGLSSAMAESLMELDSKMSRRDSCPVLAASHIGLASEISRRDSSSAMAGSHMKFTPEAPRCIMPAAIAEAHTEPTSKEAMLPRAATAVHVQEIVHLDPETSVRILPGECYISCQEFVVSYAHINVFTLSSCKLVNSFKQNPLI